MTGAMHLYASDDQGLQENPRSWDRHRKMPDPQAPRAFKRQHASLLFSGPQSGHSVPAALGSERTAPSTWGLLLPALVALGVSRHLLSYCSGCSLTSVQGREGTSKHSRMSFTAVTPHKR